MPSLRGQVRRRRLPRLGRRDQRLEERDDAESDSGPDSEPDELEDSDSEDEASVPQRTQATQTQALSLPQAPAQSVAQIQVPTQAAAQPQAQGQQQAQQEAPSQQASNSGVNIVGSAGLTSSLAVPASGNRIAAQADVDVDGVESDDELSDDEDAPRVVLNPAQPAATSAAAQPAATVSFRPVGAVSSGRPQASGQQEQPAVNNAETVEPAPTAAADPRLGSPQTGAANQAAPSPTFADTPLSQETPLATQSRMIAVTPTAAVSAADTNGGPTLGPANGDEVQDHPTAIALGTLSAVLFLAGVSYLVYRWRRRGNSIGDVPGRVKAWLPSRRQSTLSSSSWKWWDVTSSRGRTAVPASTRRAAVAGDGRTNSEMIDDMVQAAYDSERGYNDMEGGAAVTDEKQQQQQEAAEPPQRKRTISTWVRDIATPRTARFPRSEAGFAQRYSRPVSSAMLSEAPTMITVTTHSQGERRPPSWMERPVSPVSFVERPRPSAAAFGHRGQAGTGEIGIGYGGEPPEEPAYKSAWSDTQSDVSGGKSMFGSGWRDPHAR